MCFYTSQFSYKKVKNEKNQATPGAKWGFSNLIHFFLVIALYIEDLTIVLMFC